MPKLAALWPGRAHHDAALPSAIERPALDDVSFDVAPGEVFGVLGPNGSGKTTLFHILATLLRPPSGHASVLGYDVAGEAHQVRQQLGVVFQKSSLDPHLSAQENLIHQGHLYGMSGRQLHQRANRLLERFGVGARRGEMVKRFSGGMRRRVELAKAMVHRPRLLLLDEPATGLDPGARRDLWAQISQLRDDHQVTVAFTTHLMDQAQRCDGLAILNDGRLVAQDTPNKLTALIGGDVIRIKPVVDQDLHEFCRAIKQRFGPWPDGTAPRLVEDQLHLEKPDGAAFVGHLTATFPGRIQSFTVGQPTLEDVFLHLTGHTLWERR